MGHACTCEGTNENCVICGGTGEIHQNRASALIAYACRPESEKFDLEGRQPNSDGALSKSVFVVCEWCDARVNSKRIEVHKRDRCPRRPIPSSSKTELGPQRACVLCDWCGVPVKPNKLMNHRRKRCPRRPSAVPAMCGQKGTSKPAKQQKMASNPPLSKRAIAPIGKAGRDPRSGTAARAAVRASIRSEYSFAKVYPEQTTKNLDAAYGYSRDYREDNGRFVSLPSYDGFDDESTPD